MDHPRPGLRYIDASDLDNSQLHFDGMEVQGLDNQKLGKVDGFVIDKSSARPYYVVVNAGGWFKSKYFLLPIGHVGLAPTDTKLVADITNTLVGSYIAENAQSRSHQASGTAEVLEQQMRDAGRVRDQRDVAALPDDQMWSVCCIDATIDISSPNRYEHVHYRYPGWWDASFQRPDRADTLGREAVGAKR